MDSMVTAESHFLYRCDQATLLGRLDRRRYGSPFQKESLDLQAIENGVSVRID